jgi:hypothetical protein
MESRFEAPIGKLPDDRASGCANHRRGEKWWSSKADQEAYAAAPARSLSTQVITGPLDCHTTVSILRYEDDGLDADSFVRHLRHEGLEVAGGGVYVAIPRDQDVCNFLSHFRPPFPGFEIGTGMPGLRALVICIYG